MDSVFPEVLEKSLKALEDGLKPRQINQGIISEGYRPIMHQLRRDMSNNPRIYQDVLDAAGNACPHASWPHTDTMQSTAQRTFTRP